MELKVKYFGQIAEITNKDEEIVSVEEATSVEQLCDKLIATYSPIGHISFRIALNHEIVGLETLIKDGDKIGVLPPFAGG